MNFHKAKILLDKINRLYQGIHEEQGRISPIEQDLMLDYVREFYELFYWEQRKNAPLTPPHKPQVHIPPSTAPKPEPKMELPEVVKPATPKPEPKVEAPVPASEPRVQTPPKPEPPKEEPLPKESRKFEFTPPKPTPPSSLRPKEPDTDPEMELLFEVQQATELSEKLGLAPIMDLNRAFGLNDKMLYTNELFAGDNHVYKETMSLLNSFNSMNQAKEYLVANIAGKYEWTDAGRQKMAKTFIKTIRRKYV